MSGEIFNWIKGLELYRTEYQLSSFYLELDHLLDTQTMVLTRDTYNNDYVICIIAVTIYIQFVRKYILFLFNSYVYLIRSFLVQRSLLQDYDQLVTACDSYTYVRLLIHIRIKKMLHFQFQLLFHFFEYYQVSRVTSYKKFVTSLLQAV